MTWEVLIGYSLSMGAVVVVLQPELHAGAAGAPHGSPHAGAGELQKKLRPVEPQPATTMIRIGRSLRTESSPR